MLRAVDRDELDAAFHLGTKTVPRASRPRAARQGQERRQHAETNQN
jgi:hypothetical protein